MENFFIADTHFFHENIIRSTNRPFKNVNEMNEALVNNWNNVVTTEDNVYILGDFSFGNKEQTEDILKSLKGNKYLIRGNHDNIINNVSSKYIKWTKDYYEIRDKGNTIVLSHYPIYLWNKRHYGTIHLHGHTHYYVDLTQPLKPWMKITKEMYNRFMCVSVECINYTPISTTELKNKFNF